MGLALRNQKTSPNAEGGEGEHGELLKSCRGGLEKMKRKKGGGEKSAENVGCGIPRLEVYGEHLNFCSGLLVEGKKWVEEEKCRGTPVTAKRERAGRPVERGKVKKKKTGWLEGVSKARKDLGFLHDPRGCAGGFSLNEGGGEGGGGWWGGGGGGVWILGGGRGTRGLGHISRALWFFFWGERA